MKTDNANASEAVLKRNELSDVLKKVKNKPPFIISVLPFLSLLAAIVPGFLFHESGTYIARLGIVTLILSGAATFYIRLYLESILSLKLSKTIIVIGYLGSILALLFVPSPELYSFWMFGGLLVAMLFNHKLGLLFNFNLTFILGIMKGIRPELLIQILIICLLLSMLAGALKQKTTVVYASIIILSTNMTLSFVVNNFIIDKASNYKYLDSLFSMMAVLFIAFFLSLLYRTLLTKKEPVIIAENQMEQDLIKISKSDDENQDSPEIIIKENDKPISSMDDNTVDNQVSSLQKTAAADEASDDFTSKQEDKTSYEILCDLDNELILKLRAYSESLYAHSVYIGDLSGRAAKLIDADELLAMAGGFYHEVGKMNGKNYIEEGLKLAEVYSFPKELKAILKEHNIKYDKPSSVEAAIVMLADNVVSTIEYIDKTEDHKFTANKLIDNIFQMRLNKGTFDSSGISVKDYKKLKEFFQSEFDRTNKDIR